jgi:hypothetical protein
MDFKIEVAVSIDRESCHIVTHHGCGAAGVSIKVGDGVE